MSHPAIDLNEFAHKRFSQFNEDGITLELVRRLNPPRTFAEFGAGDGSENCTRVLAEEGHSGVWFDSDPCNYSGLVETAALYDGRVDALCKWFTIENARRTFYKAGVPQELGVLSIDIDGNDFHLWKALCGFNKHELIIPCWLPWVVIIEAQIQRPWDEYWVMPYDPDYVWPHHNNDCGASVYAMKMLGEDLGYTFVGKTPHEGSPNLFFVRKDKEALL